MIVRRLIAKERVPVTLAAQALRSSRMHVYNLIERGELEAERYGPKTTVVLRDSLVRWLRARGAHVEVHDDALQIIQAKIPLDMAKIRDFCRRWAVTEFALFGSVTREDFGPRSDIDVLLTLTPARHLTGLELVRLERELRELFGRSVDVVTRRGVEQSRNASLREEILRTAEVIYAQAA